MARARDPHTTAGAAAAPTRGRGARHRSILAAVALACATGAVYLPALDASFLNWDDDICVSDNPHIRGPAWQTVRWALTTDRAGYVMPLTWLSHALDYRLYGLDPRGHHRTSVLLHVANTVLVFVAIRALTGAPWQSVAVAALFGLHPLHVEAVAWVAERKEVLSAFFSLLTLLAYARYARVRTGANFLVVAIAFAAALLSKPMAMTLPAVLLLLDYWPLERLSWQTVREKVPLFAVAIVSAVWALVGVAAAGAVRSTELIAPSERVANAIVSYVAYLGLAVWPTRLSPWYSHPALEGTPLSWRAVAGAAAFLVLATWLALRAARSRPHVTVGWFWYAGTLFPVIGLVTQVGGQAMADRYTYIPLLGLFIALVWEAGGAPVWRIPWARRAAVSAAVLALATLALLTRRQVAIWHDSTTFWNYTLAINPRAAVGHYSRGSMLSAEGRVEEAIAAYRRALKLRPDFVNAHTEVGNLLARMGRPAAAAAHFRKAIAGRSQAPEDHSNLANVLLQMGQPAAARRHLEIALALRPDFAEAHNNLAIVLAESGHLDEAVVHFRAALAAKPDFVTARTNLAAALAEQQREKKDAAPPPAE